MAAARHLPVFAQLVRAAIHLRGARPDIRRGAWPAGARLHNGARGAAMAGRRPTTPSTAIRSGHPAGVSGVLFVQRQQVALTGPPWPSSFPTHPDACDPSNWYCVGVAPSPRRRASFVEPRPLGRRRVVCPARASHCGTLQKRRHNSDHCASSVIISRTACPTRRTRT